MADTIPDFEADFADWTDVYTTTGISVGTPVAITNKSSNDVLIQEVAAKPSINSLDGPFIPSVSNGNPQAVITGSPSGLWLRSSADSYKSLVNVQEV